MTDRAERQEPKPDRELFKPEAGKSLCDFNSEIERPAQKWRRTYLYGRSRANRWPLWISCLLAPSKSSRQIVRELMQLRRAGVDV